jgi:hypothetical protein
MGGSLMMSTLLLQSKLNFTVSEAASKFATRLDQDDLIPGNPNQAALFIVYDSRIPTQMEFLNEIRVKDVYNRIGDNVKIVQLDVAETYVAGLCSN